LKFLIYSDNKLSGTLPFQFPYIKYCSILPGNDVKIDLEVIKIDDSLAPEILKTIKEEFQKRDLFREFLDVKMLGDEGILVNIQSWFVDLGGNLMLRDECRDYLDGIIKKKEKKEEVEVKTKVKLEDKVAETAPKSGASIAKSDSDSDEDSQVKAGSSSVLPNETGVTFNLELEDNVVPVEK
jgi:hypothetical protein